MSDEPQVSPETVRARRETARSAQRAADRAQEEADALEAVKGHMTEGEKQKFYLAKAKANELQSEARRYAHYADDAFRDSVLNPDFTPDPVIESVVGDLAKSTYVKVAVAGAATVALIAIGFFAFHQKDAVEEDVPEETASAVEQGSPYDYNDKTYYQVFADRPEENTGTEVCAKHSMKCVGYTALTTAVCMAYHPGAQPSQDFNGSKAGFYCNGAPQGGICAKELNTCHICPECNLNMECDTQIGDLYHETFVECASLIEINPVKTGM